jgi:hypothetical protein
LSARATRSDLTALGSSARRPSRRCCCICCCCCCIHKRLAASLARLYCCCCCAAGGPKRSCGITPETHYPQSIGGRTAAACCVAGLGLAGDAVCRGGVSAWRPAARLGRRSCRQAFSARCVASYRNGTKSQSWWCDQEGLYRVLIACRGPAARLERHSIIR